MASYLDFEGVYDKTKRYIVYNWSQKDFTQHFGAESVYNNTTIVTTTAPYDITIKAGEMRELDQFQALTVTKHFVTREILEEASLLIGKDRERKEMSVDNKDIRKPYEDKTISEVKAGEESPFMQELRDKIRKEEIAKMNPEIGNEIKRDKPFCDQCLSKGVRHKADCPTLNKLNSSEFSDLN